MWAARFGPCTCGSAAACLSPLPRDMSGPEQGPQIMLHLMLPRSCWFSSCSMALCPSGRGAQSQSHGPCFSMSGFNRVPTIFPNFATFSTTNLSHCFSVSGKIGPAQAWVWWRLSWLVLVCGVCPSRELHLCSTRSPSAPIPSVSPVCLSADGGPGAASADVREVLSTRTKRNR